MTENKNPGNDPSAEFERQRKRKVLLFAAILGCIFLVVLWFIFRPAPVKPQEGAAGINTSFRTAKRRPPSETNAKPRNSSAARNSSRDA